MTFAVTTLSMWRVSVGISASIPGHHSEGAADHRGVSCRTRQRHSYRYPDATERRGNGTRQGRRIADGDSHDAQVRGTFQKSRPVQRHATEHREQLPSTSWSDVKGRCASPQRAQIPGSTARARHGQRRQRTRARRVRGHVSFEEQDLSCDFVSAHRQLGWHQRFGSSWSTCRVSLSGIRIRH